jgi:hypothetical protein
MTSTVHSCKSSIKELEGDNRTLVLENEHLGSKLLILVDDIVTLVSSCKDHLAFKLPPVSKFIEQLEEIMRRGLDDVNIGKSDL